MAMGKMSILICVTLDSSVLINGEGHTVYASLLDYYNWVQSAPFAYYVLCEDSKVFVCCCNALLL